MSTVPTTGPASLAPEPAHAADAPAASPRDSGTRSRRGGSGGLFVAPFMIFFGLFLLVPLVYGLWMSFTDASLTGHGDSSFAGLGNYAEALTDSEVWKSLGNTAVFTVLSSVPLVVLALAMALLVHANLPGQWLWRFAFFAPYVLPVAVVWQVWSMMFQPDLGLVNNFLGALGLDSVGWLVDEKWAMYAVVLVTVWWTAGFNFLLYLAALQAVPDHLYEAAALDGAGAWRRLWSITLPQLRRTTGLIAVLQVLASLKVFDQIYLLTRGGPNGSTRPILEYIYDTGFTGYRLGYASAISYVFFAILVILSLAQFKLFSRKEA
ncbi:MULTISPECIES: sugar ABC transporter permease [unclassified Streptomyces]|uniref:carbohydrate ABC transporter permease n=1 Tax=unclassified Streptomyces TaxID=2593676 RepID=UPI00081D7B26|nr:MULTISPECIES: sugar ABC transporter permease [unclassified Streptomyces]MYR28327.1 ABC transporter permease subunit [Streptomyces sp. SID4945]SCD46252.1 carbohydrate ABC transporter membrane protein 1, CUT1 family [Streptomyces sp. TverLS-915]SCF36563.1 carbohydrate ABC transporter membrane protein 1, CUT1 family [Streptomyces sp. LcepLS]